MKKFLSLVLALVMTMSLVTVSAGAKDFTDNDKITYEEAVAVMSEVGVIDGYTDGSFNPTATLTRGAAAKIICNLILGPTTASALVADAAPYSDVSTDNVFAGYIAYCQKTGIISGYADGTFRPANSLTGYAFMKMLLGALGYKAEVEGYTGDNWSIAVAKQAINAGLNAGLTEEFNGIKAVTREEACLYAFNTLKATMVDYDTTITIGGVTVAGARFDVANSGKETIEDDNKMQFAEKYFTKLSVAADSDAFGRPANLWTNNSKKIGSYVDWSEMVAEYTTGITGKDLHSLLSATTIKNYTTTYYVDGLEVKDTIKASNMIKTNTETYSTTDNGVLTQVFVDDANEEIVITSINTYYATADADYNTKKETLTVTLKEAGSYTGTIKLEDVAGIEGYEKGDVLFVNYAWNASTSKYDIKVVMDPSEVLTDAKISKFKTGSYVVTGGEQYDYSEKVYVAPTQLANYNSGTALTKFTYNVYLDQYGYVKGITEYSGDDNYVFITGYDKASSNLTKKTAEANAIFIEDGVATMKTITINFTDTNDNITNDLRTGGQPDLNTWFTYTVDKNEVYTLDDNVDAINIAAPTGTDTLKINPTSVRLLNGARAYGNDDSVYVTVEAEKDTVDGVYISENSQSVLHNDAITKVTATYTGIDDVDLIVDSTDYETITDRIFAIYDSNEYVIAAIVIGEDNSKSDSYAYALKAAQNEYVDDDDNYYWDFVAVVDGEIKTLTVKGKYGTFDKTQNKIEAACQPGVNGLFKLTYDKDGYVIDAQMMVDADKTDKIYGDSDWNTEINKDLHKVYNMHYVAGDDAAFKIVGRTLYATSAKYSTYDAGLRLVDGAPVIVYQKENKVDANGTTIKTSYVYETYTNLETALKSLVGEGENFEGWVSAVLNSKGTADYIVISDAEGDSTQIDNGANSVVKSEVTGIKTWKMTSGKLGVQLTGAAKDTKAVVEVTMSIGNTVKEMSYTVTVDANGEAALPITVATGTSYMVTYGDFVATLNA